MSVDRMKQKKVKAEEKLAKFDLPYGESVMLQRCLLFTSVLSQFSKEHIRVDYAAGKFKAPDNALVSAEELCLFYLELIPAIEHANLIKGIFQSAQEKLWMVVTKHDEKFILTDSSYEPRKCSEWNDVVMSLAFNKTYWLRKPDTKRNAQQTPTRRMFNKAVSTDVMETKTIGVNAVEEVKDCAVQTNQPIKTKDNVLLIHNDPQSKHKHDPIEENRNIELTNNNILNYHNTNNKFNMLCNFCLKTNHCEENCWKKNGFCLVCGGEHRVVNCVKNKNLSSSSDCTICYGKYQGIFCRLHSNNVNFCSWCGKRGHAASICRKRLGACYFCGNLKHQIKDCPAHAEKQKGISDYWWDTSV